MKILITGASGLLGFALKRELVVSPNKYIYTTAGFSSRKDCDLMDYKSVLKTIEGFDYVIHTAGRVGGIGRNLNSPAQQYHENIIINTNVIHACYEAKVKKLIAFSSTCAFPANVTPFTEDNFHLGEPFPAHRAYAYSKRMVDIQIEAYRKQYGVNYCCVIPGNIFGENDNYSLTESHVIPALIHKAYLANKSGSQLEVWGDGSASREFIYSRDLARVCLSLLKTEELPQRLIVSGDKEYKIKFIAELIAKFMKVKDIKWLTDKPNGQVSRPSSTTKFLNLFPSFQMTSMEDALKASCEWFKDNYEKARL